MSPREGGWADERAEIAAERDDWRRLAEQQTARINKLVPHEQALISVLSDLIALADAAMQAANNDGAEYDRATELAEARRLVKESP